MSATYAKLNSGHWGIRVHGAAQAGQLVMVTKRSGESNLETVTKVLWQQHGRSLCAIQQPGNNGHGSPGGYRSKRNPMQVCCRHPGQQSLDLPDTEQQ